MQITNLNSLTFLTTVLVVMGLYMHDAKLEHVSEVDSHMKSSVDTADRATTEDINLLSTGRHIHVERLSLPSNTSNYGTSLASTQPRNRENDDKYVAQNKLVCNTYGNSSR